MSAPREGKLPASALAIVLGAALALLSPQVLAQVGLPAISVEPTDNGGETYTLSIQLLMLMTALTLLPCALKPIS